MSFDLEKLNIVIEGESNKAIDAIDRLLDKLRELQGAVGSLSNVSSMARKAFRDIAKAARDAAKESERVSNSLDGVENVAARFTGGNVSTALMAINNSLANVGTALSTSVEGLVAFQGSTDIVASSINGLSVILDGATDALTRFRSATSFGGGNRLAAPMWDVYEAAYSVDEGASQAAKSIGTLRDGILMLDAPGMKIENLGFPDHDMIDSLLKRLGDGVKGFGKHIGNLASAFKRIAMYRMIRAAIKAVTNAVKEGLDILIEWDRTYGNNTSYAAKTADELAAKWREVKKSLGAAFMPLIQIAQPALMWLMQAVIDVANAFNQVLRAVQGYSTYMKATNVQTKQAVGAAKELKRVLFGFDELNVLPSDSGSGASASANAIDYVETDIHWLPEGIGKGVKDITDGIKKDFGDAWKESQEGWEEVKRNLKNGWAAVKPGLTDIWDGIKTGFGDAWAESKEGWEEVKKNWDNLTMWIDEKLIQPFREKFNELKRWIYEKMPWLAKLLGIDETSFTTDITIDTDADISRPAQSVIDLNKKSESGNINVGFKADTSISAATNAMLAGVNAATQAALWVKFKTDTTLSPDTQKLIGLMSVNGAVIGALGAVNVRTYASGGDPDMGTLFYAGERGAEVVATSPGGTGVMNMKQMQDAVSNGNAQTVNAVYAMANMIVGAINSKDVNSYLDGRLVTDVVARGLNNRTRATGQPVIAR